MVNFVNNLKESLHAGFIDEKHRKSGSYKPRLLVNDIDKNQAVLTSLTEELETCQSFIFSVAFITEGGLGMLKSQLLDLKRKGIKGRILTSTFLHFNQPKAFRELLKITNVEVRLTGVKGFHTKGYIFQQPNCYSLIVGSSNLTANALKVNYEWNVKLTSHENGEIIHHFKKQFEDVWEQSQPLTSEWIQEYEKQYKLAIAEQKAPQIIELPDTYAVNPITESLKIQPNKMQQAALEGIQAIREKGKGLIISATGTGKTYLSAFDVRRFAPKRMLFVVHREQILKKARKDFQKVLGGAEQDFGILSGSQKETDAKYLFATVQSLSKDDTLRQFARDHFDYILIDEAHKAGAASYHKIIDYFTPKFLLGMTATPERTDGFNLYELFDYNIAYEIRLQEALEEDMLCPFFYFGVTDFTYDNGELIDDTAQLSNLINKERVNHIMEKVNYYGYSGDRVRGLIFCSRKEEAKELSKLLNDRGYRTCALTGDDSQEVREERVRELEEGVLDYLLTVDIFNEGIDIPSINQVVMLRQTQSSIIFIQQLGRGLRKHDAKEFVTVIDFIGNYKNNYLIPVALSGDRTQNKDNIRRRVKDTNYIKGISTIHFEEIAKKQIFQSINNNNLTALKVLREAYQDLKNRIGHVPYLYDFIINHSIDPVVLVGKGNYYQFLEKMKEDVPTLTKYEQQVITMFSQEILDGKRKHELILLEMLLESNVTRSEYVEHLHEFHCIANDHIFASVERIYDLSFFTQAYREKYGQDPIVSFRDGVYILNDTIRQSLQQNDYFKHIVEDIIKSAKEKSKKYQGNRPFTLYEKYTRKDACKLLNWENDESSTVYGYKVKHQTCPIFFTYHKNDEIESSVNYGDEFLSEEVLKWYTRSNRTKQSKEIQPIIAAEEQGIDIHIFVKKDNDEGTDFYYLGQAVPDKETVEEDEMKNKDGKDIPVVHMNMVLEQEVEHNLYQYLISG